jgi:hypothetical protein
MPQLCADALGVSTDQVTTSSVIAYQPQDYTATNSDMRSVWLGNVGDDQVNKLASMIKNPSSALYSQSSGLTQQLASQIDPSLSLFAYAKDPSVAPNQGNSNPSSANESNPSSNGSSQGGGSSSKTKTTVAAVCGSFGAVLAVAGAFVGIRALRNRRAKGVRLSGSGRGSPAMRQAGGVGGGGRPFSDESFGDRTPSFDSAESFRDHREPGTARDHYLNQPVSPHVPAHHAVEVHGQALDGAFVAQDNDFLRPADPFVTEVARESAWSAWSGTSEGNSPNNNNARQNHPSEHHHRFGAASATISRPVLNSNS